jgi:hypothetical protein
MKRINLLIAFVFVGILHAKSQYLFQELMSIEQASSERAQLIQKNFRKVKVTSFEEDGEVSKRFFCEKKFDKTHSNYKLYTRSGDGGKSIMTGYFNAMGKLLKTVDSSETVVRICNITYNENNKIIQTNTISRSRDEDFVIEVNEVHQYEYENNKSNHPISMLKIKQGKDSSKIIFQFDEKGNIAIEKNANTGAKYYFYYDEKNQITDIVHQSEYKVDMVPDYIFEYDANGNLVRTTTAAAGNSSPVNWIYSYTNGLKTKEEIRASNGEWLGKFEYQYQ